MSPLRWTWVQRLFGIDGNDIPAGAEVRLTWSNLPESWKVFAVLLIVGLAIYGVIRMYHSDASKLSLRVRRLNGLCKIQHAQPSAIGQASQQGLIVRSQQLVHGIGPGDRAGSRFAEGCAAQGVLGRIVDGHRLGGIPQDDERRLQDMPM